MLRHEHKPRVLVKLRSARNEIEDALNLSVLATRHEVVVIPEAVRKELSVMVDDLNRSLLQLERTQ